MVFFWFGWEGQSHVIDKVDEKMKTLYNETSTKFYQIVLQQNSSLNTLNEINNQFAVTRIDKANGNVHLFVKDFMHLFNLFTCSPVYTTGLRL